MPAICERCGRWFRRPRALRRHVCASATSGLSSSDHTTVGASAEYSAALDRAAAAPMDDWLSEPLCSVSPPPSSPTDSSQPPTGGPPAPPRQPSATRRSQRQPFRYLGSLSPGSRRRQQQTSTRERTPRAIQRRPAPGLPPAHRPTLSARRCARRL